MESESRAYLQGDVIVHRSYGIAEIMAIEIKRISGEPSEYYRLKTSDSTIWIPVEKIDGEMIRPLSTREQLQEAIDALQRPAKKMPSSFNSRKGRIQRVTASNVPLAMAQLIRDLRARRRSRGSLSNTEEQALRSLTRRLCREWAATSGIKTEAARRKLEEMLRLSAKERPQPMTAD